MNRVINYIAYAVRVWIVERITQWPPITSNSSGGGVSEPVRTAWSNEEAEEAASILEFSFYRGAGERTSRLANSVVNCLHRCLLFGSQSSTVSFRARAEPKK